MELQHQMRNNLLNEGRPNSVIRLAERVFSVPIITAQHAAVTLDVTPPTAHSAIKALLERGDLREITGKDRNRIYEAPQIYDAVYGDIDMPDETSDQ